MDLPWKFPCVAIRALPHGLCRPVTEKGLFPLLCPVRIAGHCPQAINSMRRLATSPFLSLQSSQLRFQGLEFRVQLRRGADSRVTNGDSGHLIALWMRWIQRVAEQGGTLCRALRTGAGMSF